MEGKEVCSGSSSRWQPSKEQLEILESVYSAGVKTPSAEQIQQITARLSEYGHIEGKNVFYWFQNTKARRRQKIKEHQRLAYLPRFYPPPLFPTTPNYVPPLIPKGMVNDVAAGYYYYPYGMARVEPTRECKTLELFPLHPGCSSDHPPEDEYYYHYCAQDGRGQQEDEGGPGFIDFFSANANGCSSTTTTVTDRSRD